MLALATLLLLTAPTAEAKGKPGRKSKKTEAAAEKADTTKKEKKGYEELLKGAVTDKGMFDVLLLRRFLWECFTARRSRR